MNYVILKEEEKLCWTFYINIYVYIIVYIIYFNI